MQQFFEIGYLGASGCWVHVFGTVSVGVTIVVATFQIVVKPDGIAFIAAVFPCSLRLSVGVVFFFFARILMLSISNLSPWSPVLLLIQQRIISFFSVYNNDIYTCYSNRSWVIESIFNELLFDGNFEFSIFLLQFTYDVFHVLFDLVLFFNFESVSGIDGEFGVSFVFLFADEDFHVIKLGGQKIALNHWQFISDDIIICFNLNKSIQVWRELLIIAVWWTWSSKHFAVFVKDFVGGHQFIVLHDFSRAEARMLVLLIMSLIVLWGRVNLLSIFSKNDNLFATVLHSELFVGHLNEHVIIHFMRSTTLKLPGDSAVDYWLHFSLWWLMMMDMLDFGSRIDTLSHNLLKILRMICCLLFLHVLCFLKFIDAAISGNIPLRRIQSKSQTYSWNHWHIFHRNNRLLFSSRIGNTCRTADDLGYLLALGRSKIRQDIQLIIECTVLLIRNSSNGKSGHSSSLSGINISGCVHCIKTWRWRCIDSLWAYYTIWVHTLVLSNKVKIFCVDMHWDGLAVGCWSSFGHKSWPITLLPHSHTFLHHSFISQAWNIQNRLCLHLEVTFTYKIFGVGAKVHLLSTSHVLGV